MSEPSLSELLQAERELHIEDVRECWAEIERLRAGIAGARDRLERCFEPTVPLRVIQSELERAVKDAYITLRRTLVSSSGDQR
jgi:hypothetical protein